MLRSPVFRIAMGGAVIALALTLMRYLVGGWYDDVPNTLAGFGSAGVLGAAIGAYVALMVRKYGQLRAITRAD
ncbi:hypothetical protein [Aurantiacibacter luteus]|uniref:Uncharacterized protein n=1 Tax=Aurantiacibacter luteus TaxID=1581420 RepID=A0A0G9MYK0_9SPHN|nr:hypothetical protein [Aurantiacibacter luteus]KLE35614.1 hypothetical protein AAW00_04170 [Aurantiacibacter luteus]